ncbi:MAG: SDR family NAD(P)-dependent oxidoreductase [Nitrococcus sp.]|nr:SDR family NAD(P)-dependent oxidoreductase [Nitrococcus sp.]
MLIEDWENELKTNLYGHFFCSQQFIRRRRTAGGKGKIINITSVHQEIPRAGAGAYDVAKGGWRFICPLRRPITSPGRPLRSTAA